jgi:hypothetical protein
MHGMIPKIHQSVHILHCNQIDTATITAIAAIRAAHGDVFLTPKADSPIAAITRFYTNFRLVNKSHNLHAATLKNQPIKTKKAPPMKVGAFLKLPGYATLTRPA